MALNHSRNNCHFEFIHSTVRPTESCVERRASRSSGDGLQAWGAQQFCASKWVSMGTDTHHCLKQPTGKAISPQEYKHNCLSTEQGGLSGCGETAFIREPWQCTEDNIMTFKVQRSNHRAIYTKCTTHNKYCMLYCIHLHLWIKKYDTLSSIQHIHRA